MNSLYISLFPPTAPAAPVREANRLILQLGVSCSDPAQLCGALASLSIAPPTHLTPTDATVSHDARRTGDALQAALPVLPSHRAVALGVNARTSSLFLPPPSILCPPSTAAAWSCLLRRLQARDLLVSCKASSYLPLPCSTRASQLRPLPHRRA